MHRGLLASCLALVMPLGALRAQATRRGGELAYGEGPPSIGHLNPYASISRNGPTDRVLSMIYEPLFRFNFNKEEWENVLAARVDAVAPTKGKSAFKVTLRQATWHDGKPFTAADVVFTYDYIRAASANRLEREQASSLFEDVREGALNEVIFEFRDVVPDARYQLLDFIIPLSRFTRPGFTVAAGQQTLDQSPLGTGPYKFDRFATGYPILSVFDQYHGPKGNLASVRSREFTDVATMVQTLNTAKGDINLIPEVPGEMLAAVESNGGNTTAQTDSYNVYAVALRQKGSSILTNENVRRALTMAVNRRQILANWFVGKGVVLASPVTPRAPFYDPTVKELPFSTDSAKRILREAGAVGRTLVFIYPIGESGSDTRTASAVRSIKDAIEAVGVHVEERPLRPTQFERSLYEAGDFDMAWVRWEFSPAYDITPLFVSANRRPGGFNYMNFSDPLFDRAAADYVDATDPSRRSALMKSMQKMLNEKAPAIFLVNEEMTYAYHSRYKLPPGTVDPFHFFTYITAWWLGGVVK